MKWIAGYHAGMRRRLVNILCILSLLPGVAAIARRASISPTDVKAANTVMFDRLWGIACDDEALWAEVNYPAEEVQPFGILAKPVTYQFAGIGITYISADQQADYEFKVPWWVAIVIPLILPAFVGVQRYRHRTKRGHCSKCRYDLMGNTSGLCPECGTSIPTESQ